MNESKDLTSDLQEAYNNYMGMYDTVGCLGFGEFALLKYDGSYYTVCDKDSKFTYIAYTNKQAAGRAWGHICDKFERWWVKQHAED
jgi:hypothetical protein